MKLKDYLHLEYLILDDNGDVDTIQQVKQFEDKRTEYYTYILNNKSELLEVKSREFSITKV